MKKILSLIIISATLTGCWHRIGDLTSVSNRNIDPNKEYVEYRRNVTGKAKARKGDPLEKAIDNATELADGEYLVNVKIYIKRSLRKVKVEGDVWGCDPDSTIVKQ